MGPDEGSGGFGRSNLVSEVEVISADGSLNTKSTIAQAFISGWTPDSTQLVCYRDWIYLLVSLDGTRAAEGQVPQTPFNRPEWVSYSPSLATIVWTHMVDKSRWTIETPDRVLVSTESPIGERAIPSPNGRYIAVYGEYSPTELKVYDTQTGKWSDLGKISIHPDGYSWHDFWPSWNPWFADSSRLAFFVGSTLVISTPDGQQKTETVIDVQAGLPLPSPDGKSIAFVTAEPRRRKANASAQFWGNTTVWAISTVPKSLPRAVTQKSEDATYDLNWLNNNTVVFDRIADEVFYQRTRIWKANVPR
jgi:hypothetical protein